MYLMFSDHTLATKIKESLERREKTLRDNFAFQICLFLDLRFRDMIRDTDLSKVKGRISKIDKRLQSLSLSEGVNVRSVYTDNQS